MWRGGRIKSGHKEKRGGSRTPLPKSVVYEMNEVKANALLL